MGVLLGAGVSIFAEPSVEIATDAAWQEGRLFYAALVLRDGGALVNIHVADLASTIPGTVANINRLIAALEELREKVEAPGQPPASDADPEWWTQADTEAEIAAESSLPEWHARKHAELLAEYRTADCPHCLKKVGADRALSESELRARWGDR